MIARTGARTAASESSVGGAAPCILIVDDDPDVCKTAADILRARWPEARLHCCWDPAKAFQTASALEPNVLVTDLSMPGVPGFTLCLAIRDTFELRSTKILAMTGFVAMDSEERALHTGADAFLAKPFTPDELRGAVERLLGPSWSAARAPLPPGEGA